MEEFAFYLLKSVVWLAGFTVIYLVFLRDERFFVLKRAYLLTGIIASFIFPLITLHYRVEIPASTSGDVTVAGALTAGSAAKGFLSGPSGILFFLIILYVSGIIFLGYRLIHHIISLRKVISSAEVKKSREAKLVKVKGIPASFSFFNYVFMNPLTDDEEEKEILNHELIHVRQKHWLDLIFAEFLCLVQWVNPFAWIYTRLIRQNHEYLADEEALKLTSNPGNYRAALINQLFNSKVISLSNSFNYSLNQTRFNMMKKIIASPYRKLKALFILPVFMIVFYAFAKPDYKYTSVEKITEDNDPAPAAVSQEVRGIVFQKGGVPLPGAAIVIKGTTIGTISDNKGLFKLVNVSGDALLVVTYVGFKSKVIKPVFNSEMKIEMVQDTLKVVNYEGSIPPPPPPPPPSSEKSTGASLPPAERQSSDAAIPPLKDTGINIRSSSSGPMKNPLIVVDGVIKDISVNSISPEVIQSISVLKGESATSRYGVEGKDGVIIITSKTGSQTIHDPELWLAGYASEQKEEVGTMTVVEEMPLFPGGGADAMRSWLARNIKYPEEAVKAKITGIVNVVFVVGKDGKVKNVEVVKPFHPFLDAEAVRVVRSMPDWKPGSQSGKPVDVRMVVPVMFSLK